MEGQIVEDPALKQRYRFSHSVDPDGGAVLHVETWVERLGRTSITLSQTVHGDNKLAADIRSVIVHFDYATGEPRELTSEIRDAMAPFKKKGD